MRNRRRRHKKNQGFSSINITPLVDVMLVLLIVFMVTAPMLNTGISLKLPKVKTKKVNTKMKTIQVSVGKHGAIFVNTTKVNIVNFMKVLQKVSKNNTNVQINIKGDYRTSYGNIAQIMGKLSSDGYNNIALITDNKKYVQ